MGGGEDEEDERCASAVLLPTACPADRLQTPVPP